jgi:hypothetical protein
MVFVFFVVQGRPELWLEMWFENWPTGLSFPARIQEFQEFKQIAKTISKGLSKEVPHRTIRILHRVSQIRFGNQFQVPLWGTVCVGAT